MYINKRKSRMIYPFLCLLTVFMCWLFTGHHEIFGAQTDWINQHSVIPDYFRQQFYSTGKFFPEFAPNLGGGQNIYNFAYYGLFSPLILPSYLLPFIKMEDYLMAVSIVGIAASVCLLYYWLGKHNFSQGIRLGVALMYLLAGPVIHQACHQVMFVNYMPFLFLALIGIDRYFEKKKSVLYLLGVFLMIMTSFYFSIGGILALVLYGIYRYFEFTPRFHFLTFFKDGIRFLLPVLTAVCMSGILLVPTALALFGRGQHSAKAATSLRELLLPQLPPLRIAYSPYGLGLTALAITVLIVGLTYRNRNERLLNLGCLVVITIPFFAWILNGGLYIRDKAVIPFLPLICYLIALYLRKNDRHEIPLYVNLISAGLTLLMISYACFGPAPSITNKTYWLLLMADGIIMLISILIFYKFRNLTLLIVPPLICLMLFHVGYNAYSSKLVSQSEYTKVTDSHIGTAVNRILQKDSAFYRIEQMGEKEENSANLNRIWSSGQWTTSLYSSAYNTDYQNFRTKTFQLELPYRNNLMQGASKNPLFQRFMGVKYQISQQRDGTPFVTQNENTAPIAYATDRTISEKTYKELTFPYNQTALMNYAVVKNTGDSKETAETAVQKNMLLETAEKNTIAIPDTKNAQAHILTDEGGNIHVTTTEKTTIQVPLPVVHERGKYNLYLQFQVKNLKPNHDISVWIDNIQNKLSARNHIYYNENTTFTYSMTLPSGQTTVTMTFGKGDYELTDMQCYTGAENAFTKDMPEARCLYQSAFKLDRKHTEGSRISGSIDVSKSGYFITSIPYDKNFTAYIDGKQISTEKVNTAFLGFPINAGNHRIVLLYHAPGVKTGNLLSLAGLIMAAALFISSQLSHRNRSTSAKH